MSIAAFARLMSAPVPPTHMRDSARAQRSFTSWSTVLLMTAMLSGGLPPPVARADDALTMARAFESALVRSIEKSEKSVVSLSRVTRPQNEPGVLPAPDGARELQPWQAQGFIPQEFGSGVIVARNGADQERYVLTAAHVVFGRRTFEGAPRVTDNADVTLVVRLASRHTVTAEVVAIDPRSDLAVLRLQLERANVPVEAAPPITMGDAADIQKGRIVIALGNPYAIARDGSVSASIGIISNISRKPWPPGGALSNPTEADLTIHHYGTLLHVDARLSFGFSGGALVDLDGRLIGLTTSLAALQGYEKSAGFAVPIDAHTRRIIDGLLEGYEVEYGFLGIQPGDADAEQLAAFRALTTQAAAARVRRVAPGSPADRAGLIANDIVLAVNDVPVYADIDLVREVGWLGPDVEAKLLVLRPQERRLLTLQCRLGKWPVYDDSLLITTRDRYTAWRGLHVDHPTARLRYLSSNPLGPFPRGVVITRVDAGTPAAAAGLREGQFITLLEGAPVATPAEFLQTAGARSGTVSLTLSTGEAISVAPAAGPDGAMR